MRTSQIIELAHQINQDYFGGKIDLVSISFVRNNRLKGVSCLGRYCYSYMRGNPSQILKQEIQLSGVLFTDGLDVSNLIDTLAHELTHAWQAQSGWKPEHTHTFKNKAYFIRSKSNGKINIDRASQELKDLMNKKRNELAKGKKQYAIIRRDEQICFLRSMTQDEIDTVKAIGWRVLVKSSDPLNVKHSKNASMLFKVGYYSYSDFEVRLRKYFYSI